MPIVVSVGIGERASMPQNASAAFDAVLERHHDDLPVYIIVPPDAVAAFAKQRTFVAEAGLNGEAIGRRTVKPWGDGRWFFDLTKRHCVRIGLAEGDKVRVCLVEAAATPPDLADRIEAEGLGERWNALSEAQKRSVAEPIFDAKRAETRGARIERAIALLRPKT